MATPTAPDPADDQDFASYFAAPSHVKASPTSSKRASTDFFSRQTLTFAEITAQNKLRRKERHALRSKERRSRSTTDDSPASKKRRLSETELESSDDDSDGSDCETTPSPTPESTNQSPASARQRNTTSNVEEESGFPIGVRSHDAGGGDPHANQSSARPKPKPSTSDIRSERTAQILARAVISGNPPVKRPKQDNPPTPPNLPRQDNPPPPKRGSPMEIADSSDDEIEEEFPELAQRAKEIARQKLLQQSQMSNKPQLTKESPSSSTAVAHDRPQKLQLSRQAEMKLSIEGFKENLDELWFRRLLDQNLDHVRKAWWHSMQLKHPLLPPREDMILTWKGIRMWPSTTLASLGFSADSDGGLMYKGRYHFPEGGDDYDIQFRAMTIAGYETKDQVPEQEDSADLSVAQAAPAKQKAPGVKIILRGAKLIEVKTLVETHKRVEKLIRVFRNQNPSIPPDKEIVLQFDGESLDPDQTLEGLDLEDLDIIEVHIK